MQMIAACDRSLSFFLMVFRVGRFAALVFPRSPVGAAQAVLYAMGAMLPPIPPSISFLGVFR